MWCKKKERGSSIIISAVSDMFCGYCGKEIAEKNNFCPYCGKETKRKTGIKQTDNNISSSKKVEKNSESTDSKYTGPEYYKRPSAKPVQPKRSRVGYGLPPRKTIKASDRTSSVGTADIASRVSSLAGAVVLLVSGFLPFLQPNAAADALSGIANMMGMEGAEPFKLTTADMLPMYGAMAGLCVALIIAVALHGRIPQLVFSILCLLVCIAILYICSSVMDDSRVRMVYEYGSGHIVFILGTVLVGISILLRIASNMSGKE